MAKGRFRTKVPSPLGNYSKGFMNMNGPVTSFLNLTKSPEASTSTHLKGTGLRSAGLGGLCTIWRNSVTQNHASQDTEKTLYRVPQTGVVGLIKSPLRNSSLYLYTVVSIILL